LQQFFSLLVKLHLLTCTSFCKMFDLSSHLCLVVTALATFPLLVEGVFAPCESFSSYVSGSQYFYAYTFVNSSVTFTAARNQCQALHPMSDLISIRDQLVWNWANLTIKINSPVTNSSWIGLLQNSTLVEPAGNWYWADGSSTSKYIVTWRSGEPNNFFSTENCGEFQPPGYNDQECSKQRTSICEVDGDNH
jgi:hypothetical protein